ncbi:MAG: succinate--CoA ligase subunit alpha, partial [Dehalococcoidia bacterium]
MSILVNEHTRLLVQGITGRDGSFHAMRCKEYGTNLVAGVTPGKGGTNVDGVVVYNSVQKAVEETAANTALIFVPAPFAADAILESADAGIPLIICITEGIPVSDMV